MSVPVIFSTGSLYTFGLDRVFTWISASGFDGVEVMMDDRWDTHQEDYLAGLMDRYEVPILALHPPIYAGAWRLPKGETLVRSAKLAAALKIPTVVAHPPRPGRTLDEWRDGPLAEARHTGVTIAVENMPRAEGKGWRRYFGEAGSSYLAQHLDDFEDITLDTSHVAANRLDLLGFYGDVATRIRHVHLSDSDLTGGDQHRLPGKGKLPLLPLLDALARDDFGGTVSLELKPFQAGAPHPEKVLQRMGEALKYVRRGLGSSIEGTTEEPGDRLDQFNQLDQLD
ncbi:MAG: sugar phosphate isomerase/epimerase family protein [Rubrobacter sp.]